MKEDLITNQIFLYGDEIGSVEYVQHMGEDITVVNSARVSFGKHKDTMNAKDEKLIKYLINHRHTSTLEHNVITFRFVVPLYIRSQHHRHRTWSYNEISRRYTEENLRFYEPAKFRTQHKSNRQASNLEEHDPLLGYYEDGGKIMASSMVRKHHVDSIYLYNQLMDKGVCREQARGVLPQNLYTEYYGTVNLNNLLKFVGLRIHEGAQWEIQMVAKACLTLARQFWPITINAYIDSIGDETLRNEFKNI
jgi:thymidylate synthase (FAD)